MVGRLLDWFAANARDLPWRHTRDPYAIWVSEVMLQQTQVQTVVPYWNRWMQALPNLGALAAAPLDHVLKLWEGLGYYHRARNLQRAAQIIVHRHDGIFPSDPESVLALPGIGSYTAGAICSLAYNLATPVLDGNVVRVLTRLHGIRERVDRAPTRRRLEKLASALVSAAAAQPRRRRSVQQADWRAQRIRDLPCGAVNEALMELGAVTCIPGRPRCERCPLSPHCVAYQAGIAERLPSKPRRAAMKTRHVLVFVCRRGGRWLVRQRPGRGVNAGLWELPNLEVSANHSPLESASTLFTGRLRAARPLLTLRHTITRHRITIEVHDVVPTGRLALRGPGEWRMAHELERLAFPAAHRKIVRKLLEPASPLAEPAETVTLPA